MTNIKQLDTSASKESISAILEEVDRILKNSLNCPAEFYSASDSFELYNEAIRRTIKWPAHGWATNLRAGLTEDGDIRFNDDVLCEINFETTTGRLFQKTKKYLAFEFSKKYSLLSIKQISLIIRKRNMIGFERYSCRVLLDSNEIKKIKEHVDSFQFPLNTIIQKRHLSSVDELLESNEKYAQESLGILRESK